MSELDDFTATLLRPAAGEATTRRLGSITLRVVEGPIIGLSRIVREPQVRVGRGTSNEVVLDDAALSMQHFELSLAHDHVVLRDLGSRNGTWVGGARVLGRIGVPDGGEFCAGSSRFQIRFGDAVELPLSAQPRFGGLLGSSTAMRELFALLRRLAPTPLTTLVLGETGCGKEEVARALHNASGRPGDFVVLDCGTLPRELAEATILGHRKGAFTGATSDRPGCFEQADRGTLFIDEIGELPLVLQPKLLRVLDRHEVQRVGDHEVRRVDVRVVAATHRDLRAFVVDQRFRLDLLHRVAQVTVRVPPLRERPDDIDMLARHFARALAHRTGREVELGDDAVARLRELHWEGNVRQLRHTVERSCYLAAPGRIGRRDLVLDEEPSPASATQERWFVLPLKDALARNGDAFARRYCEHLLRTCNGDLDEAARRAEYSRKGLRELLRRVGLLGDDVATDERGSQH